MSDKYPSLSPYCYSADNPVVLVDPNGMCITDYYEIEINEINIDSCNAKIIEHKNSYCN